MAPSSTSTTLPGVSVSQGTVGPNVRLFGELRLVPAEFERRKKLGRGLPFDLIRLGGNFDMLPEHPALLWLALLTSKLPPLSIATP
jgi:hypothetical protein